MASSGTEGAERIVRLLSRWRYLLLGTLAVVNGVVASSTGLDFVSDQWVFEGPGRALISGDFDSVFSDAGTQTGPFSLLLSGVVTALSDATGIEGIHLYGVVTYATIVVGVAVVVRLVHRRLGTTMPLLELGAGLLALIAGLPLTAYVAGHPAEALIPLVWVIAAIAFSRDRPIAAGAWIAVAAGLKPWGVLGIALALLGTKNKDRWLGLAVGLGGTLVLYLPLIAAGDFSFFSYEWAVSARSPMALVLGTGAEFPWWLRAVQAAVVVIAGGMIAARWRNRSYVYWVAPLVMVLVRLLFDPLLSGYYWLAAGALALIAVATIAIKDVPRRAVVAAAIFLAASYASFLGQTWSTVARFLLLTTMLGLFAFREPEVPLPAERRPM